jgi:hypothetical protein
MLHKVFPVPAWEHEIIIFQRSEKFYSHFAYFRQFRRVVNYFVKHLPVAGGKSILLHYTTAGLNFLNGGLTHY